MSSFSVVFFAKSNPLSIFQWNKRLLVVVTPNADNKKYVKQKKFIENKPLGLRDRDIHVVKIIDKQFWGILKANSSVKDVLKVFDFYKLNENIFSILLIGKDGDEKLRSVEPLSMCILFDLIDTMPMRQNEILEKGRNVKC